MATICKQIFFFFAKTSKNQTIVVAIAVDVYVQMWVLRLQRLQQLLKTAAVAAGCSTARPPNELTFRDWTVNTSVPLTVENHCLTEFLCW